MVARADFDTLRSLGFAGISGAYAVVGSSTTELTRLVSFMNDTDGDLIVTNDNTVDKIFLKAGSYKIFDVQSNINPQFDDRYVLPIGTQWYVKQSTAPTTGSVYIEMLK